MKDARCPSLSVRLVRDLVLLQAAVVILWILAWMAFSPYVNYEEVAAASAHDRVSEAVVRARTGELAIRTSPRLREYAARRPGFAFAALDGAAILQGSSPELSARIGPLVAALPRGGALEWRTSGSVRIVRLAPARTPHGEVAIATTGDRFLAEDWPAFAQIYLPQFAIMFGPAILAAALAVPAIISQSMRSVREAAEQAAAIEISSLDRRLPDAQAPSELRPFIAAINGLLQRIEDGVARQRMFTANAAHELRTPVAILNARVDTMPDGAEKWDLKRDLRRLRTLVDQLLSAARLGQGVDTVDEDIDFVGLVHDLVSDMAPLAIRSGRQIEFCAGAAARVRGDSEGLRSAIANLIDNALRAEPEGGGVAVSVRTGVEGRVAVEVSDHGPGVARHDRELAFEPFWRKDNHHPGAGLGLSIALEIARRHEGVLSIHDTPGGGATFRLDLPGGGFARTHPAISAVHS